MNNYIVQIEDCPDYYVTRDGKVLSYRYHFQFRELKPKTNTYPCVVIKNKDNKAVRRSIHRLVARYFIGECPTGYEIHHKDGNGHNNNASNLVWVKHKEHHGLGQNKKQISKEKKLQLIADRLSGTKLVVLSERYGISEQAVCHIMRRYCIKNNTTIQKLKKELKRKKNLTNDGWACIIDSRRQNEDYAKR